MKKLKHYGFSFSLACFLGIFTLGSLVMAQTVNKKLNAKQETKKVVGKKKPTSTKKEQTFEVPTTELEKNVGLAKKLPMKKQVSKVAPSEALKRERPNIQKVQLSEEQIETRLGTKN